MASLVTTTVAGSLTTSAAINDNFIASFTNTHASGWGTLLKGGGANNTDYSLLIRNQASSDLFAIMGDGEIRVANQTLVDSANTNYKMTFPDNSGIAMGSAYTFANIYGNAGNIYLRANAYPANTGSTSKIYLQTANSSGGQASDVVVNNGNVGIGNASPYYPLHVQGPTGFNGEAKNNALLFDTASATTGTGGGLAFGGYSNGTGGDIYHFGNIQGIKENSTAGNYASAMLFSTRANGATPLVRMRITSAGSVGIGEATPSHLLHIRKDQNAKTSLLVDNRNGGTGASASIFLGSNHTTEQMDIRAFGSGFTTSGADRAGGGLVRNSQSGGLSIVASNAAGETRFYTAGSADGNERMRIKSDGDVGIGTANPTQQLMVWEGSSSVSLGEYSNGAVIWLDGVNGDLSGGDYFNIWADGNSALRFGYGTGQKVSMLSSGNVGIGTNAPGAKLDIVGNSNTIPALKIGANATHGFCFYERSTEGDLRISKKVSGTEVDVLNIARSDGDVGFYNNVGIGTAAPGAKLHVYGGNIRISSTDDKPQLEFFETAAARWVIGHSNSPNNYFVISEGSDIAASERLVIAPSTGSVGIGTTAPDKLLHLSSSEGTAVMRFSDTRTAMTTGDIGLIEFETFDTGSPGVGGYILGEAGGSGGQVDLAFAAGLGGSATEVMRIVSEGNVGIGTIAPAHKLHIASGTTNVGLQTISTDTGAYMGFEDNSTGNTGSNSNVLIGANGNNFVVFTNATERVRIDSSGNVGIGTNAPVSQLQVGDGTDSNTWVGVRGAAGYYSGIKLYRGTGTWSNNSNNNFGITVTDFGMALGKYTDPGSNATGRADYLTVKDGGNVGIGTHAPEGRLHIYNGSSGGTTVNVAHDDLIIENSDNVGIQLFSPADKYQYLAFGDPGGANRGYVRYYHTDDRMVLRAGGSDTLYITGGKVGIGTATPDNLLTLRSAAQYQQDLKFTVGSTAVAGGFMGAGGASENIWMSAGAELTANPQSASGFTARNNEGAGAGKAASIRLGDSAGTITFFTASSLTNGNTFTWDGGSETGAVMSILNDGNVGIGTANPSVGLEVAKTSADASLKVNRTDQTNIQLIAAGSSYVRASAALILQSNGANNRLTLATDGTATFSGTLKANTSITLRDGSGTNVGALTVVGGNNLTICGSQANHCGFSFATNAILPATEGATNTGTVDLGASSNKFKDFYLSGAANIGGVLTVGSTTFANSTRTLKWPNTSGQLNSRSWGWVAEQGAYGYYQLYRSDASDGTLDTEVLRFRNTGNAEFKNDLLVDGALTGTTAAFNSPSATGVALAVKGGNDLVDNILLNLINQSGTGVLNVRNNGALYGTTATFSGIIDLSGVNKIHQLSGHNFLQGDATMTYLYGGSGGGQIRSSNNTSSLIQWLDSGRIGIGATTTPGAMLELVGGTINGATQFPGISGKHGSTQLYRLEQWFGNEGFLGLYLAGTKTIQFRGGNTTSGAAHSYINTGSGNNFGVGTSSPSAKLFITGDSTSRAFQVVSSSAGNATGYFYTNMVHTGTDTSATVSIRSDHASSSGQVLHVRGDGSGNLLTLDQGGTNRFVVRADGNVGIGTPTPGAKLHVTGAPGNSTYLSYLFNSATHSQAHGLNVQIASSGAAAYGLRVNTAGDTNALAVMGDGKVGMGTYTPDAKLHLYGTGIANTPTLAIENTTAGTFIHSVESFSPNMTSGQTNIIVVGRAGSYKNSGYIGYKYSSAGSDNNLLSLGHWGSNHLVNIKGDGNVGIGTTSPTAPLDTIGRASFRYSNSTTEKRIDIEAGNAVNTIQYVSNRLDIYNNSSVTMTMLQDGNVGIGTTAPAKLLTLQSATSPVLGFYSTYTDTNARNWAIQTNNLAYGDLTFSTSAARLGDPTVIKMSILKDGKVGIGTAAPGANLEVRGATETIPNLGTYGTFFNLRRTDGHIGLSIGIDSSTNHFWFQAQNSTSPIAQALILNPKGGSVGIGTNAPEAKLHVVGGIHLTNASAISWDQYDGTLRNAIRLDSGDDLHIGDTNFDDIRFSTGQKTDCVIIKQTTGYVGVGSSAPAYKLDIVNATASDWIVRFHNTSTTTPSGLLVQTDIATSGYLLGATSAGVYKFVVQNNGNVGIGTVAPNHKLHVNGNSKFESSLSVYYSNARIHIGTSGSSGTFGHMGWNSSSNYLYLGHSYGGAFNEDLVINGSGDVGIGTNAPSGKLEVRVASETGTSSTHGIRIGTASNAVNIGASDSGYAWLQTRDADPLSLQPIGGNVGIGTTASGFKLRVEGTGFFNGSVVIPNATNYFGAYNSSGTPKNLLYMNSSNQVIINKDGAMAQSTRIEGKYISFATPDSVLGVETEVMRVFQGVGFGAAGCVGIGVTTPSSKLDVNGTITGTSKNFNIPHPDPSKVNARLIHASVEAPSNDTLYKFEVVISLDNETVTYPLPSYFKYLNKNPQMWIQARNMFSHAYGSCAEDLSSFSITGEKAGSYDVLIIATRKDEGVKGFVVEIVC